MSDNKRILIIILAILGTPFLCLAIGYFVGGTRQDPSNLAAAFALIIGIVASVVGGFLGLIVGLATVNSESRYSSFFGFVTPPSLAILYILLLSLLGQ